MVGKLLGYLNMSIELSPFCCCFYSQVELLWAVSRLVLSSTTGSTAVNQTVERFIPVKAWATQWRYSRRSVKINDGNSFTCLHTAQRQECKCNQTPSPLCVTQADGLRGEDTPANSGRSSQKLPLANFVSQAKLFLPQLYIVSWRHHQPFRGQRQFGSYWKCFQLQSGLSRNFVKMAWMAANFQLSRCMAAATSSRIFSSTRMLNSTVFGY